VGTFTRITLVCNDSDFECRLEHNETGKLTPCRELDHLLERMRSKNPNQDAT
jgi:hypothetical protein